MALSKDSVKINIEIDRDIKESLENLSKELDLTLSNLLRNLILLTLHDMNLLRTIGLFTVFNNLRMALEKTPLKSKPSPVDKNADTVLVSVTISKETKILLDRYAKDLEIPIIKLARNFIYSTLDDYNFLKKTGLLRIAFTFKKLLVSHQEFEGMQHE